MKYILSTLVILFTTTGFSQHRYQKLFKEVDCSVVIINVTETISAGTGGPQSFMSSQGLGSGTLISEDGLILTAAHVIQTADNITVTFQNGSNFPAEVVGSYTSSDVAMIRALRVPEGVCVSKVGDSDKMEIGDEIMIIGAPYGLSHSLSVGYISGRHKEEDKVSSMTMMEFFQTDAAINQGNSGGPMFNSDGEVIGIVSYILSKSGGFEGLGFAATSNVAKKLLLEETPFWTGLEGMMVTGKLAALLNVPQSGGFLVQKVSFTSPAANAGLRGGDVKITIGGTELLIGGDIILEVGNIKLNNKAHIKEVYDFLASHKGTSFKMKFLREGRIVERDFLLK